MPAFTDVKSPGSEQEMVTTQQEKKEEKSMTVDVFAFIEAAGRGDFATVSNLIVSKKVGVNVADYDARTALHVVCSKTFTSRDANEKRQNQMNTVQILIDNGANLNAQDNFDQTPLDEAVRRKNTNIALLLRKNGGHHSNESYQQGVVLNAVAQNNITEVQALVECGVSMNCADYDRRTPLHLAVDNRNLDMIKFLVDHGADAKAKDRFGRTPLAEALNHHSRGYDPIKTFFEDKYKDDAEAHHAPEGNNTFLIVFGLIQLIIVLFFCVTAEYNFEDEATRVAGGDDNPDFVYLSDVYGWFMDVHVMIFIGFGFLMTFLRKYSFSAVGLTFLIGAYCIQLHILVEHALLPLFGHSHHLEVNILSLILGDFAAAAVLITYGVLLGKVGPMQLMTIATIEIVVFTANELIGIEMGITDVGGSMVVHMFGAFFGLSCSIAMKDQWIQYKDILTSRNASVYQSDIFAMIGTVFLWMFWPSFNVCLGADDEARHMGIVNTVLALCGSCVVAFLASHVLRGEREFCMVDIQNATLAGGVAMGTSADLNTSPGLALIIGGVAGFVSVFGYTKLQFVLEEKFGLHDTCGVNNLHGMPSIIGAVAGVLILAFQDSPAYSATTNLSFMFITLLISIGGGLITGMLVKAMVEPLKKEQLFEDAGTWEVPSEETPYFFDVRGEVQHDNDADSQNFALRTSNELALLKERLDLFETRSEFLEAKMAAVSATNVSSGGDVNQLAQALRRLMSSAN